jgi:HK97 family phage major capsid protein
VRTLREITTDRDALKTRRETITRDLEALDRLAGDEPLKGGPLERWENLRTGAERIDADIERLDDEYRDNLREGVETGRYSTESGDGARSPDGERDRARNDEDRSVPQHVRAARDAGLRTIERHRDALTAAAADNLDNLIRKRDPHGVDARYIAAVGEPAYFSAFGKMLADPQMGHLRFTAQEVAAVQATTAVESERALNITTGSAGGFALPFTLDPSVILSSNGVLNPIRDVARVFTIATNQWKGVSSDGVTAAYVAEAAVSTDNSPTLAQPTITAAQGRAWIPFSIELSQDWPQLSDELVRLVIDGRDTLDATQFLTGTGTNAPLGILTIGTAGALTTTQRVQTDVSATLDVDDVWDLKGNLTNTRFAGNARFAGNSAMIDRIYRFTPSGSTTEPQAMPTREGALCGKPVIEWSTMVNTTTTGSKVLIFGDWQHFLVGDRLGMSAELIPHIFGAAQGNLPTGQRGLFCYWRTGTVVSAVNAFRYLEVL